MLVFIAKRRTRRSSILAACCLSWGLGWISPVGLAAQTGSSGCPATKADIEGPYYEPNAPVRIETGKGLKVSGRVGSVTDCKPLAGARIEWWSADGSGNYKDEHRATVVAGKEGSYRYETVAPSGYFFRPPHLHVKVSARGHRTLITQIYPVDGQREISFDFNLVPE